MKVMLRGAIAALIIATATMATFAESKPKVNPTGFPIVNEKITVNIMCSRAPNQADWSKMELWKWYEEKTNIHVNWIMVDNASINEKRQLVIASGDIPDAFFGCYLTPQEEIKYGADGIIIPLEKLYAQYAPNVTAYLNSDKSIRKTYTAPDGHIYTFPSGTDRTVFLTHYTEINTAWLAKLNLPMPKTTDDFYAVLKAFKEKDPNGNGKADEIPLTLQVADFWPLMQWFGIPTDIKKKVFVDDNGKVVYVPTDPRFKKGLEFFNKLYKEGLLDQESFIQDWKRVDAKGQNKDAEILGAFDRPTIAWSVGFDRWKDYAVMPALKNYLGTTMVTGSNVESKGRFSITSKCKYPEAMARWIDYFATYTGSLTMQYGPEGIGWVDNKDGTWSRKTLTSSVAESITPKNGTYVPYINFQKIIDNEKRKADDPGYQDPVYSGIDKYLYPSRRAYYPDAYMSADQVAKTSHVESDLNSYVEQMIAMFITGGTPLTEWDSYVAKVKKMGSDDLVKVYQAAYDSYNH
jgi:putative aldouronate transport system substrate-binding protein